MRVAIFGKDGCAKCESTKRKIDHYIKKWGVAENTVVDFYNMDTPEGLAEGAYQDVLEIPTTIISRRETESEPLARWEGIIPHQKDVKSYLVESAHD